MRADKLYLAGQAVDRVMVFCLDGAAMCPSDRGVRANGVRHAVSRQFAPQCPV